MTDMTPRETTSLRGYGPAIILADDKRLREMEE